MKSLSKHITESLNEGSVSFEDVVQEFKINGFMLTKVSGTNNTYDIALKKYAKTKGKIEKYGNKTVLTWGSDYEDESMSNDEIMDIISTLVNEGVNESKEELFIEVASSSAKEANEILKDLRNIVYENDGSNRFIFKKQSHADDAYDALKKYVEITDKNI